MFKYILKRLGLSLIVLLGVSVIIYCLVRLMPTNYLETKFSSQLQQGTMTHDQLDDFKKRYGLYMPEAYLTITVNEDGYADAEFKRDVKLEKHEDVLDGTITYAEFYAGEYEAKDDLFLDLKADGTWRMLDKSDEENIKTKMTGSFVASADGIVMKTSGKSLEASSVYSVATFWNKTGAVLSGYFQWLGNMLRGDLGDSFLYQQPVGTVIAEHMWISFLISLVALIFQFAISIPLGIVSATRQYSAVDYTVTILTMIGISLPSFFFAALLIKIFSSWLGWFPAFGLVTGGSSSVGFAYVLDMLHHLVLPMLVLVVLSIGGLMRYTRTNMLEVLNSDYIRTARSKGLSEKKVIYVHAFRNTMIPLMTLLAGILPSLFGGAMITEEVFAINGIGRLAYKALQQGDIPFIMGYNMFLAVLTVIGTLLSDLMYAVVDPRVKLSK
jgi:peptide/nickel transport system permease protein